MNPIDFGRHSQDYGAYRPGPPRDFYTRLGQAVRLKGSLSLDLATGPGTIALELGARGSKVVGIDISDRQVREGKRLSRERGLSDRVRFQVGTAEATGLDGHSFDLVTAGQCWHWFDGPAVLEEVRRVLREDGLLAIVYYSYLAEHSPVARDSEELILQFNPGWTMAGWSGLFPEHIDEVIRGGFSLVEGFCFDRDETFSHGGWRGRMRTCNGVGSGGLSPEEVARFDAALGQLLKDRYPETLVVTHRLWCVLGRKLA